MVEQTESSANGVGAYGITRHAQPFPYWDRRRLVGEWDVEQSVQRIVHYKYFEERLSAALGGWGATMPEMDCKNLVARHCYEHAWHADLWRKRLPELREVNEDRSEPPNDAFVRFVDKLTEPFDHDLTMEKLVGIYRVAIPHLLAVYTFHQHVTSDITDSPTVRILGFMLQDDHKQYVEGEMMIQDLAATPELRKRAGAWQLELDLLLGEAGGICGPGTLGGLPKIQKPPHAVLGDELRKRREAARKVAEAASSS